jgi:hypothetical protein
VVAINKATSLKDDVLGISRLCAVLPLQGFLFRHSPDLQWHADTPLAQHYLFLTWSGRRAMSYYSERFIGDIGATSQRYEPNTGSKKVSSIKRSH